jgi:hypothetical protein
MTCYKEINDSKLKEILLRRSSVKKKKIRLQNKTYTTDPRLGRIPQFDERSKNFDIMSVIEPTQKPRNYTWSVNKWLDQDDTPYCVGFAWTHELIARPVQFQSGTKEYATKIYHLAQDMDEWPGNAYEGTSVLAGAKAVHSLGHLEEYRWSFELDDLILAVGYKGPAVIGVNWYEGMLDADSNGFIHVTGYMDGGHAILCNRVNVKLKEFGLWNSWDHLGARTEPAK